MVTTNLADGAWQVLVHAEDPLGPWSEPVRPVLVTALDDASRTWTTSPAEPGGAARRVCTDVAVRLLVADLLTRLRLHERRVGHGA